ncbi:MAG: hypothetical protein KIS73_26830 [Enhydrobacter sp.]|nr:hypothetical protein [Enhydrobacter sp.]
MLPLPPDVPVLEVFYSPSCAPCRLELPVVAQIAAGQEARVRIVILDQPARARNELRTVSPALEAAAVDPADGTSPREVLRAAGEDRSILPYARSLTPDGAVCAKWSGGLTMARAQGMLDACRRLLTSPRRSRP